MHFALFRINLYTRILALRPPPPSSAILTRCACEASNRFSILLRVSDVNFDDVNYIILLTCAVNLNVIPQ